MDAPKRPAGLQAGRTDPVVKTRSKSAPTCRCLSRRTHSIARPIGLPQPLVIQGFDLSPTTIEQARA
jgi:hypothetical protein